MKLNLLALSFLSAFALSLPAAANQLISWRFYPEQNRLVFTTDARVQPTAVLLANPTRLVIDLPGIFLQRPTVTQPLSGAIRSLRVGQFDDTTTRLVIELHPGYTLDHKNIVIRGATPQQWSVQIPTPQRIKQSPDNLPPLPPWNNQSRELPPSTSSRGLGAQIQSLQVTENGFFIRTTGTQPEVKVSRTEERRTINIDIFGATLFSSLFSRDRPIYRYGVSRIQFQQLQTQPRVVRLTLNLTENSPDWQAFVDRDLGVVLQPVGIKAADIETPSPIPYRY